MKFLFTKSKFPQFSEKEDSINEMKKRCVKARPISLPVQTQERMKDTIGKLSGKYKKP
jgi:hypothetical protein